MLETKKQIKKNFQLLVLDGNRFWKKRFFGKTAFESKKWSALNFDSKSFRCEVSNWKKTMHWIMNSKFFVVTCSEKNCSPKLAFWLVLIR